MMVPRSSLYSFYVQVFVERREFGAVKLVENLGWCVLVLPIELWTVFYGNVNEMT
jgi:hypothetical protein